MLYEELEFWGIPESLIADCCWRTYASFAHEQGIMRQVVSTLDFPTSQDEESPQISPAYKYNVSTSRDVRFRQGIPIGNSATEADLSLNKQHYRSGASQESPRLCEFNQIKNRLTTSSCNRQPQQSQRNVLAKKDEKIRRQFSPRTKRNKSQCVREIRNEERGTIPSNNSHNSRNIYEQHSGSPNKERLDGSALTMSATHKQMTSELCCDVTKNRSDSLTSQGAKCSRKVLQKWKKRLYFFLEYPQSSRAASVSVLHA